MLVYSCISNPFKHTHTHTCTHTWPRRRTYISRNTPMRAQSRLHRFALCILLEDWNLKCTWRRAARCLRRIVCSAHRVQVFLLSISGAPNKGPPFRWPSISVIRNVCDLFRFVQLAHTNIRDAALRYRDTGINWSRAIWIKCARQ